jgi:hypothetical protein
MIEHFVLYRQWPGDHAGRRHPLGEDVSVRRRPITIVVAIVISI